MILSKLIKILRRENHLTQKQLAELTGFSHSYISRLEAGDFADGKQALSTLNTFAKVFKLSLEEFVKRADLVK